MKINLRIQDIGEQTFYLQPVHNVGEYQQSEYILVRSISEIDNPPIKLKWNENNTLVCETEMPIIESGDELTSKMSALTLEVVDAQIHGIDLSAEDIPETLTTVKPYDPDLIRVEPSTMSLRQVNDMIKDGDINLSPDFQRNAIWDYHRKCRLIESILLRIPLPVFYFSADKSGQLSVVDGLQRLTAIKEFMDNKLPLDGLEYLDDCKGCTYNGANKLDERMYRRFNLTQITTNVIDSSSPTKVKYDIFRRLNTGGRPLNAQELRNCLSSETLRETLRSMAKSQAFMEATTYSVSDERMESQECALRFMLFRYLYLRDGKIEAYSGAMDSDLDEFVDFLSHEKDFPFQQYIDDYNKSMVNAEYLFGRHAFRKVFKETEYGSYRSVINKALFIALSVLLADYNIDDLKNNIEEHAFVSVLGNMISEDEYLFRMLSYGTNGWKNLVFTFGAMDSMLKNGINGCKK